MLAAHLNELAKDSNGQDALASLVVTALGPDNSFYICWKTKAGEYKQGRYFFVGSHPTPRSCSR